MQNADPDIVASPPSPPAAERVWAMEPLRLHILQQCTNSTLICAAATSTAVYLDAIELLWGGVDWTQEDLDKKLGVCTDPVGWHCDKALDTPCTGHTQFSAYGFLSSPGQDRYLTCLAAVRELRLSEWEVFRTVAGQSRLNPTFLARGLRPNPTFLAKVLGRFPGLHRLHIKALGSKMCYEIRLPRFGQCVVRLQPCRWADQTPSRVYSTEFLPRHFASRTLVRGEVYLYAERWGASDYAKVLAAWQAGDGIFSMADRVVMQGVEPTMMLAMCDIVADCARDRVIAGESPEAGEGASTVAVTRLSIEDSSLIPEEIAQVVLRVSSRVTDLRFEPFMGWGRYEHDIEQAPDIWATLAVLDADAILQYDSIRLTCDFGSPAPSTPTPTWFDAPTIPQWRHRPTSVTLVLFRHVKCFEQEGLDHRLWRYAVGPPADIWDSGEEDPLDDDMLSCVADHALAAFGPAIELTIERQSFFEEGMISQPRRSLEATALVRARFGQRVAELRQGRAPGWRRLERGGA